MTDQTTQQPPAQSERSQGLQGLSILEQLTSLYRGLEPSLRELVAPRPLGAPVDDAEMDRRAKILCVRAERETPRDRLCYFCGEVKADLRRHLKREHSEQVRALPPALFSWPNPYADRLLAALLLLTAGFDSLRQLAK